MGPYRLLTLSWIGEPSSTALKLTADAISPIRARRTGGRPVRGEYLLGLPRFLDWTT